MSKNPLVNSGEVRGEVPGAAALADRIPGPHGIRVDAVHQLDLRLDAAGMARHIDPVVVVEPQRVGGGAVDEQPVLSEDLAQPGILRMPGMVHLHRPLRDRVQRESGRFDARFLEWRIPERQRVEIGLDPGAVLFRRHDGSVSLRRQTEALQRLDIELKDDRFGRADQAHRGRGFEIGLVGVLVVELLRRQFVFPEAAIRDVAVELLAGLARPCPAIRRPRRASRRAAQCRGCARAARCNPCNRRDSAARPRH